MTARLCGKTGLSLVPGPVTGFRIAQSTYGPLNPVAREAVVGVPRGDWSRWDTAGKTVYIAGDQETAFRECLAWARMTQSHKRKLGKLAALWGITPEQAMHDVDEEFAQLGHMQPGHVPFSWRDERLMHTVAVPPGAGEWVDIDDQDTLDALSLNIGSGLSRFTGREEIDRSHIYSNDREVTTRISEFLRGTYLDNGDQLAGIRFRSRVADGMCWAFWLRREEIGLTDPIRAGEGVPIPADHPALVSVTSAWEIRSW